MWFSKTKIIHNASHKDPDLAVAWPLCFDNSDNALRKARKVPAIRLPFYFNCLKKGKKLLRTMKMKMTGQHIMRQLINVLAVNFCSLKKIKETECLRTPSILYKSALIRQVEREKTHSVNAIPKYESQTHYFLSFYGGHFVIYSV